MKKNKKNRTKMLAVMSVLMLLITAIAVQTTFGVTCYQSCPCPVYDNCSSVGTKCDPGQPAIGAVAPSGVESLGGACQIKMVGALTVCIFPSGSCGTRSFISNDC